MYQCRFRVGDCSRHCTEHCCQSTTTAVCPGDDVQLNIVTNPQSCGVGPTLCSGTPDIVTVGTGTGVIPAGSPTQYPTVYGHYSKSARHQFLFTAAELLAQLGSGGR
jgi:hypothetical protein